MNRKDFGSLVAALRRDLEWTQSQLAEYGGIDIAVLSQVERGVKRMLPPDLLVKLATAFQLTTLERQEFLFAATGIGNEHLAGQPIAALPVEATRSDGLLEELIDAIECLQIPAFLLDSYSDVLAANLIAFGFFQVPSYMMANAEMVPGGFNTIRLVFGKDLAMRSHFTADWDAYARNSMAAFRRQTLRYRAQPYFQYLFKTFRNPVEYPLFDRYWRMVSSVEQDQEGDFQIFSYGHDRFGHLEYMASSFSSTTQNGELTLVQYLPLAEYTKAVFDGLAVRNGQGVMRLASWPDKKMV